MAGRMLRILGVLTVVAGVLAMHGLTSHHDAAMAAPGMVMTHTEPAGVHVDPLDDMDDMGGACMAVLTGLVLLLALALGLRSQLVWRAVSLPATSARFVLGERSPPRSVRSLGVLRI